MYEVWNSLRRVWLEYFGRKNLAEPYTFSNYEIFSPPFFFRVSYLLQGTYLNLHPTLYAVGILADGARRKLDGGVNIPFPPGKCTLHYVDKTDRQSELLKITENTLDAARIVLAVKITYRISNPVKVFDIQKPVETLFSQIQADLKEYIRTRLYEDLIGNDDNQVIDSNLVAKYIKQQHNVRYPISQVFTIVDVIVQEKEGDPMFIEKRKNYKSQMVDGESKIRIQDLNKKIASQEAEMDQLQYKYKAVLDQQKANADVAQNAIRQQIAIQEMDIQKMQDKWQQTQNAWSQKQARWLRSMEAVESAFKSPYLRDQQVREIVSKIFDEQKVFVETDTYSDMSGDNPDVKNDPVKNSSDQLDKLTDTLFNLLDRQKPKE